MKDLVYLPPRLYYVDVAVEAGFSVTGDIIPGGGGGELRSLHGDYELSHEEQNY